MRVDGSPSFREAIQLNPSRAPAHLGWRRVKEFEFTQEVGRGGFCRVYKEKGRFGRPVAIKVEGPACSNEESLCFINEIDVLKTLNHPNIIESLGDGKTADGSRFLAMEAFNGGSIEDLCRSSRRVFLQESLRIVRDVASALAYLHDKVEAAL
jgi:serine/threonine protein kinase